MVVVVVAWRAAQSSLSWPNRSVAVHLLRIPGESRNLNSFSGSLKTLDLFWMEFSSLALLLGRVSPSSRPAIRPTCASWGRSTSTGAESGRHARAVPFCGAGRAKWATCATRDRPLSAPWRPPADRPRSNFDAGRRRNFRWEIMMNCERTTRASVQVTQTASPFERRSSRPPERGGRNGWLGRMGQ